MAFEPFRATLPTEQPRNGPSLAKRVTVSEALWAAEGERLV